MLVYYKVVYIIIIIIFFFQAEDGIRDWSVTGVQTCALPILWLDYNFERSVYTPELKSSKMQDSFYSTTQNLLPVVTDTGGRGQHYFRLG